MSIEHRISSTGGFRPSHWGEGSEYGQPFKRTVYERTEAQKKVVADAIAHRNGLSKASDFGEILAAVELLKASKPRGKRNG